MSFPGPCVVGAQEMAIELINIIYLTGSWFVKKFRHIILLNLHNASVERQYQPHFTSEETEAHRRRGHVQGQ